MKTINLPPYAPTLIESTRAIGYSLGAAVADIIDNSIAAEARNVDIFFFPADDYLAILDDGKGMNSEELNTAMQYGSKSPVETRDADDLGRFGLGLKTASLSQARRLTVITKQGDKVEGRRWDIDYVTETGEWSLIVLDREEIFKTKHISDLFAHPTGTLVIWENLDRLKAGELDFDAALGRKMDEVRDHLSLVFHRYLSGEKDINKLKMKINQFPLKPIDPFLEGKSYQPMADEELVVDEERPDETIIVRPYILPHISKMTKEEIAQLGGKEGLRKQQGFYIYRNKRLLIWGTWFRMMAKGNLSRLARIRVDIPNTLDDLWTLDIKKSTALPPAGVKANLKTVIKNMAEKSKRTWTFRGKKETGDGAVRLWNRMKTRDEGTYYEINREHPLVKQISNLGEEAADAVDSLLQQIELNLPLNQIYVDLNADAKIENDREQQDTEIQEMLQKMLSIPQKQDEKLNFLNSIESISPFSDHPDLIKKMKKELEGNE